MRIIYNGIDLQVLDIQEAVCQPIYDESNTDLLFCLYRISANVMVSGLAAVNQDLGGPALSLTQGDNSTQWAQQNKYFPPGQGNDGAVPAADPTATSSLGQTKFGSDGSAMFPNSIPYSPAIKSVNRPTIEVIPGASSAAVTLQLLHSKLNEPRAQLWVFDGDGTPDELIIQSHNNNEVCDCKNGPRPIATSIVKAFGDGATFFLNFQVETYVDLRKNNQNTGMLISNRFSTTHTINADSLTTIVVNGVAHCKTNIMYSTGKSPDSLRKSLFLPVPGGFVREQIQVTGSPDGSTIYYSYMDVQQPVNFVAGRYVHATQIEAVHRQTFEMGEFKATSIIDAYDRSNQLRLNRSWRQSAEESRRNEDRLIKARTRAASKKAAYYDFKMGKKKP